MINKKPTVADALRAIRDDKTDPSELYDDAFWKRVEQNVDKMNKDFNHPDRDLTMSYETLHKPFTI